MSKNKSKSNTVRLKIEIEKKELSKLPFFKDLDSLLSVYIDRKKEISYVIWGGIATNLLFQYYGITNMFYSLHDIELFLTKNKKIYVPKLLISKIDKAINDKLLIGIGGNTIITNLEGNSIDKFQEDRIKLKDGDLFVNNFVIAVKRDKIHFDGAFDILEDLVSGNKNLELKNSSSLQTLERISRRIYRTIAKVIRFEIAAKLILSEKSKVTIAELIKLYSNKLLQRIESPQTDRDLDIWLSDKKIFSHNDGILWLYEKTISETTKRLAGLFGVSSLDKVGFYNVFFNPNSLSINLFDNSLVKMIEYSFENKLILTNDFKKKLSVVCYLDFKQYQKPGAEKLFEKYSLKPLGLYGHR